MRGEDRTSGALFSYVDIEGRIPARHPLRAMRRLTNAALADLDRTFSALYEAFGRPSIPPERLLRATLLQLLYSIRSERQLVERIDDSIPHDRLVARVEEKVSDRRVLDLIRIAPFANQRSQIPPNKTDVLDGL